MTEFLNEIYEFLETPYATGAIFIGAVLLFRMIFEELRQVYVAVAFLVVFTVSNVVMNMKLTDTLYAFLNTPYAPIMILIGTVFLFMKVFDKPQHAYAASFVLACGFGVDVWRTMENGLI